jgi:adenosylhomocysteine nucleosidase
VLNYLNVNPTDDARYKGRSFYEKMVILKTDNVPVKVVVTQQLEQGNRSVISAYNAMVNTFHPKLVVLLDIAGSINKDLELCDVVLPNSVVYYELKKETENKTNRRGEAFKLSAKVKQLINKLFIVYGEPAKLKAANNSIKDTFTVQQGPIGSGESVIADKASDVKKWLLEFNSKTLAIEMESGGFLQAFYEDELTDEQPEFGALVIRGISDHADFDKDDKWRIPAAENGTIVLGEILGILSFK